MPSSYPVTVSCTSSSATILQKAVALSKKLNLPFRRPEHCATQYMLTFTDDRLELRKLQDSAKAPKPSSLFVDFLSGGNAYRHLHNCTIRQPLARAVGIKSGFRPDVFDATAGLGADAFVLACLGSTVFMCERSKILWSLLKDGLDRAMRAEDNTADIIQSRMDLILGDSQKTIIKLNRKIHTIYLDPMYPHSKKSALNKIEMRMIRDIVGDDVDSNALLTTALQYAGNRVVVKRPKGAERIGKKQPSHIIEMKNSRFDVYLTSC